MGTNYYHERVLCEHCGNVERVHIGKSSFGWTFSFRAHDGITSYADWLRVLQSGGIVDEYGDRHSLEDFMGLVAVKRNATHNHAREYPDGNFLDPEGHSFSWREFS